MTKEKVQKENFAPLAVAVGVVAETSSERDFVMLEYQSPFVG